jgi:hypothetical protein
MSSPVDVGFAVDDASAKAMAEAVIRGQLKAARMAVRDVTREFEQALETETADKVPGRLWRAWKSRVEPKAGLAAEPAGFIFVNGGKRARGAIAFFTRPGRITGKDGLWLAIPLPAAGPRGRNRDLTPGEWERRTGQRLRFVFRPGRPALLVADAGTLNARTGQFRPITRRRTAADERRGFVRGTATVPIFVLVPAVQHRNSVSIEKVMAPAGKRLIQVFEQYSIREAGGQAG